MVSLFSRIQALEVDFGGFIGGELFGKGGEFVFCFGKVAFVEEVEGGGKFFAELYLFFSEDEGFWLAFGDAHEFVDLDGLVSAFDGKEVEGASDESGGDVFLYGFANDDAGIVGFIEGLESCCCVYGCSNCCVADSFGGSDIAYDDFTCVDAKAGSSFEEGVCEIGSFSQPDK